MTNEQKETVRRAMLKIYVEGNPKGREAVIEEAIKSIQKDGATAFKWIYLGVKNYASFGDQRFDCEYGMCPRHGSIVFSIGRKNRHGNDVLGSDEIFALEALRDFGTMESPEPNTRDRKQCNLFAVLRRMEDLQNNLAHYSTAVNAVTVESSL